MAFPKIPKVEPWVCAKFARIIVDEQDYVTMQMEDKYEIEALTSAAMSYCSTYTGLEVSTTSSGAKDLEYAVLCVFAEMYDARGIVTQYYAQAPVISQILNLYSINLLPESGD